MGDQTDDGVLSTADGWASPPPPETVVEIGNLLQAYVLYTDRGRATELAALFTDDATWDGRELGYGLAEGREAIVATVLGHFDATRPMMHVPGPPLLVEAGDGDVRAVSWCLATRWTDGIAGSTIWFHYHDELRRQGDGRWRFRRRRLLLRSRPSGG